MHCMLGTCTCWRRCLPAGVFGLVTNNPDLVAGACSYAAARGLVLPLVIALLLVLRRCLPVKRARLGSQSAA